MFGLLGPSASPKVICRRSDVLWALEPELEQGLGVRQTLAQAPRPVLHLLRSCDLAKVDAEQREEVYRHNVPWLWEYRGMGQKPGTLVNPIIGWKSS